MRKFLVLIILFSISIGLQHFGVLGNSHNSVLLAIGLVILAAYTLSEIGSTLKLPQVTGYILTGLLLGPFALKILSIEVVQEIEMFNTLAIGLIAITAGLELHFSSLKKVIAPILSTTILKIILLMLFFVGAMFGINEYVFDFNMGTGLVFISLSMIFGALALGTSPAISIAVISEMKAKSRMSQMVLGSAIVKDVAVVILLAVVLSFAKSVLSGGGDMAQGFIKLMEELGYSLVAGALLGGIFIAYIKFIGQEMFLFIAAMILGTAEISHAIHLELLLVFIVAGIVVRNFSDKEHILHEALEKVSLPVFVVFFTNVGAGLDLTTTWKFLPVAAILFGARSMAFLGSSWLAGKWHNESPGIQKRIWLGYLPQAGVTLGLIQIASRDLTDFSEYITNIGIGLVTLNLLIGPILLRLVLKGEEPDQADEDLDDKTQEVDINDLSIYPELPPATEYEKEFELLLHQKCEDIEDDYLEKHLMELSINLHEVFQKNQVGPQKNILVNFVEELGQMGGLSEQRIVAKIDDHFRKMGEKGREIHNAISLYQKEIEKQLVLSSRPYPQSGIYIQKSDTYFVRFKKLFSRPYFWLSKEREREVPLRKIAKYNIEPFIGAITCDMINSWFRLLGKHIEIFQKSLETHTFESSEIVNRIEKENEIWLRSVQSDYIKEFSRISNTWVKHLNQISTSNLPDHRIRYSHVEPEITERFEKAKNDFKIWEEKFIYCRNRLKVIVQSALLSQAIEKLIAEKFFSPVETAKSNADQLVKDVYEFFDSIETELRDSESFDKTIYQKLYEKTKEFTQEHLQADIKTKYVRGSFRLLNRDISINLKRSLPREEGSFQIASETTPAHQVSDPSEILVKKINLTELFEQNILINFLPVIEERIEGVSNYLESLLLEMEQAFSIINFSLESQLAGESDLNPKELQESLLGSIASEREKIEELYQGLNEYVNSSSDSTGKLLEECQIEVKEGIERFSVVSTAKNQFRQRLYNTVQNVKKTRTSFNDRVNRFKNKFQNMSLHHNERNIDKALNKKLMSKTLDTTTVRQFINETYQLNTQIKNLPRVYFRLFSLDPIQDKRFFVAHQNHWEHFANFSKEDGFTESQKILIIGDRGIGKSSLINVAQMEIQTERLIRIESIDHKGPLAHLAQVLGCKANVASVVSKLRRNPATVIIDNVDHMVNRHDLTQFEMLFEVIKQSPPKSHWVLSITKYNLDSLDQSFKIRSLFSKLIDLHEVGLDSAREIILGRHRLSGLEIEYPKTFISDFALKVGLSTEDEMYFRILFERSHGHLRHLVFLWLQSLQSSDGKTVELSLSKTVDRGLPMIQEFSFLQKYILNELYNYHHLSVHTMSQNLGVSYSIVDNETQYLEHCGLITPKGIDRSVFEIPNELILPVGVELKKEGILYEGSSQFR